MKKFSIFAMTALTLAACSSDNEPMAPQAQNETFRLTSQVKEQLSRAVTDLQATQVAENQQLGVFVCDNNEAFYSNVAVTADASGNLNPTDPFKWGKHTSASVVSYHPYNAEWSDLSTAYTFSVQADQSTDANYLASDLLYGTASGSKGDESLNVTFTHKMAKIVVTINNDEELIDLEGTTIKIAGVKLSTSLTLSDGTLGDASGDASTIAAGALSTTSSSVAAVMVPQTVVAGTKLIQLDTEDGDYYTYAISSDKEFASGYQYNYTLSVVSKTLVLKSATITNWTSEDAEGEFAKDYYPITWATCSEASQWLDGSDYKLAGGAYVYGTGLTADLSGNSNNGLNKEVIAAEFGFTTDATADYEDWTWTTIWFNQVSSANYYYYGNSAAVTVGKTYTYTVRFKVADGEWYYADENNFKTITVTENTNNN